MPSDIVHTHFLSTSLKQINDLLDCLVQIRRVEVSRCYTQMPIIDIQLSISHFGRWQGFNSNAFFAFWFFNR